jgi:YYY domain-containing protein
MNSTPEEQPIPGEPPTRRTLRISTETWVGIALFLILVLGAYLRFTGINWDEGTHLHPDERFLNLVESAIKLPGSLSEYFNTDTSPLNPYNSDYTFFVYGTFPIFLVRYVAEWVGQAGYDQVQLVGRTLSASFDLISLILLYLVGARLYSRKVGLLAALFGSLSVLLIQHAHFFVVDPIANTFVLAGILFAVRVQERGELKDYLLFGLALGLSVASKISTAPLAGLIALAGLVRVLRSDPESRQLVLTRTLTYLIGAALVSVLVFRIFQPYAFSGPGFFGIKPNPNWLANMAEIREQQAGNTDAPYALQWADRKPLWFTFKNMVLWGLGMPLGITAWIGWAWAAFELLRKRIERHLIPVIWTGLFFIWQSIGFTKAMRYQIPIYPVLALLAAWALLEVWKRAQALDGPIRQAARAAAIALSVVVVGGTAFWAFAFTSIYRQPFTRAAASRWIYSHVPGAVNLVVNKDGVDQLEVLPVPPDFSLAPGQVQIFQLPNDLFGKDSGDITGVLIPYAAGSDQDVTAELTAELRLDPSIDNILASADLHGLILAGRELALNGVFDRVVVHQAEQNLFLVLRNSGGSDVSMRPTVLVHETTWDDGLPWGIDGRSLGGRYEVRNLELYWHDDQDDDQNGVPDKLERIADFLDQGEYITISSNRQYGTISRVTVRYPLTTAYYRALLDCPDGETVLHCYATAQEGERGLLGYTLYKVFESNPRLGPIEINDQAAEEAFTVYDHPKVLIFKKDPDFDRQHVIDLLSAVDVSHVIHVLPKDANSTAKELLLPADRWEAQQSSGTWSDYFNLGSILNRSGFVAAVVWWISIGLMGILVFPVTRVAFGGLENQGYALSRLVGLLLFAWVSWMAGSVGIPVSRPILVLALLVIVSISGWFAYRDREQLRQFFKERWRVILWLEAFALIFFILDLLIRYANPDLWKPGTGGGEKPMDFSYLNAVLKSATFPPYDPWFAGGYINYYYYGFVIVGMPIKLLGIEPALAYNLVLPTLFSLLALGGYTVAANLVTGAAAMIRWRPKPSARIAGVLAALLLVLFGNLGTARMFYDGFKKIGREGQPEGKLLVGTFQAVRGMGRYLTFQDTLPYGLDQWYWNPSRAITPAEGEAGPITEFPFFTFIYADLHAHMISRPLTVMSLAWGLSWLRIATKREKCRRRDWLTAILIGALTLGALRLTNTWDFPVYWALGLAAVIYAGFLGQVTQRARRLTYAGASALALLLLAQFTYFPFHYWYGQGYESVSLWTGSHTSLMDYLTVHGHFLFLVTAWMLWELREWMAATPLSSLARLRPHIGTIVAGSLILIALTAWLTGRGIQSVLIIFPLGLLAALLLFRPGLALGKRIALVFIGSALVLTLVVEVIVLRGDIDRMNTVFKFYMQVWELLALAAGAATAWTFADLIAWRRGWRWLWTAAAVLLLFSAALYPITAAPARIRDRFSGLAPHTLNGMTYMQHINSYSELGYQLDLEQDYEAIRWMQENVSGTPVIIEANVPEYRFGSRFTIYTGLPGVLGWRWHQVQQRISVGDQPVNQRSFDILHFYLTGSIADAMEIVDRYGISYIIVGDLEQAYYANVEPCWPVGDNLGITCDLRGYAFGMPGTYEIDPADCTALDATNEAAGLRCPTHGLDKFPQMVQDGQLRVAFQTGNTVIYQVQE